MPAMIANHQIVLHREGGKRRTVLAGSVIDLTDAEIEELTAIDPNCLREPVNEVENGVRPVAATAAVPGQRAREPKAPVRPSRGGNALTGAGSKAKPAGDDDL